MKEYYKELEPQYKISEKISTIVENLKDWETGLKQFDIATAVLYCHDGIQFLQLDDPKSFTPTNIDLVISMRIFNENKELLWWRDEHSKGKFRLRSEEEQNGPKVKYFESLQLVKGNLSKIGDNLLLEDDSGTNLTLPFKTLDMDFSNKRVWLKCHNYLGASESGEVGIVDSRFVQFLIQ